MIQIVLTRNRKSDPYSPNFSARDSCQPLLASRTTTHQFLQQRLTSHFPNVVKTAQKCDKRKPIDVHFERKASISPSNICNKQRNLIPALLCSHLKLTESLLSISSIPYDETQNVRPPKALHMIYLALLRVQF